MILNFIYSTNIKNVIDVKTCQELYEMLTGKCNK